MASLLPLSPAVIHAVPIPEVLDRLEKHIK